MILAVALGAGGCGKPAQSKKIVIGFSQIGAESAWRTAETNSFLAEAEKRRVTMKFSDAQGKQENQIKAVRSFIAQGVSIIFLAPVVETGWEPVLQEAKQAGIPVILVDRNVKVSDKSLYVTRIAPDCEEEGRIAARWLADKLKGKGNIVELEGTVGSAPAISRKNGFHEVLEKFPDLKVIKMQSGDFLRAKGKEVMEAILKSVDPKTINALYAHNDDMAIGAIQAIEEAGLKPAQDILVVSIDGVKGAFEAMAAGKLNMSVECNPMLAPLAFDAAEKILAGEKDKLPEWTKVPTRFFEQSQAKDALPSRLY
ncbi:MAG: ABC transporter substrate-binding protein [Candidatus Sumerlaeota bacterium]|nr:ABC transporter substrate-binding protein [Candidatus Sumerlaeota bacterium]